jgi:hypothetical protein
MLRNTAHKCLNYNITSIDICDIIVSYMNINEYDNVVKEFTIIMTYHNYKYAYTCEHTVIPYIFKLIRKGKMYKMLL